MNHRRKTNLQPTQIILHFDRYSEINFSFHYVRRTFSFLLVNVSSPRNALWHLLLYIIRRVINIASLTQFQS